MHLHELRNGVEAGRLIGTWIGSYNEVRPQSALYGRTPGETATARGDVSGGPLPELTDTASINAATCFTVTTAVALRL